MTIETTWLEPTGLARGQDHLATRAVCEILYTQLLPGLTNVTDRARYFTLYPWLLWVMDQERVAADDRTLWFRKADCLLTLISLAHGDGTEHGRAAVGSNVLGKALDTARVSGEPIQLSRWARTDRHAEQYFAAKRGGLGQYYQGPLEALGIVGSDDAGGLTWSRDLGLKFATAVDAGTDRARFARCLRDDQARVEDLEALSGLCLCGLTHSAGERDAMLELLWRDVDRRRTLGLVLALARDLPEEAPLNVEVFRGVTATGALSVDAPWALPDTLEVVRKRWAIYQRSEWLSLAIQGLFWATLVDLGPGGELPTLASFGDHAVEAFLADMDLGTDTSFEDAVARVRDTLPAPTDWAHPDHEHARALRIFRRSTQQQVATDALRLVLALVARGPLDDAFHDVTVSLPQRQQYPVNLLALGARSRDVWTGQSLANVVRDLVTTWGVRLHEHVALRKLRNQLTDTFQVRQTERGTWQVIEAPLPAYGNPRFVQAVRVLTDLGALGRDTGRPTPLGHDLLGRSHV